MAAVKDYQPLILVDTAELPEDEWLEWRRRGIGGSDAAAILGVSPFATARDLYYDKLKIVSYEDPESNWVQKKMGHLLEDLVAEIFHRKTGYRIYQMKKMFYHPEHPYMLADIDYFIELPNGKTAILEIKTTNYNAKDHWWRDGEEIVPINYEIQGRHYMCVMNVDEVYYCCLYGNNENEVIIRHIERELLNEGIPPEHLQVKLEEVTSVIQDMIMKGEIVCSNGNIYQTYCFVQEDETARKIAEILAVPSNAVDITAALSRIRQETGIAPSQRQTEAVYMAYHSLLSIITGGPGTGKTTVLRVIIEIQKLLYPDSKILLAAPTGRASRRMAESTGMDGAKTLHSLLGLLGDSEPIHKDKQKEPLDADLIIVDESSMIDMWLARQFFQRVRPGTRIVLVGDVDQLQSVGAGDVFRELIDCGLIPVTVLDEIFRQKKGSLIARNAKKINRAEIDLEYGEDFRFVKCQTQEEAADLICRIFCEQVREHGIEKVQILSPFRSDGLASVEQLNVVIREMVNPVKDDAADLKVGSRYFRAGDKVMQTKNNAKASNGDIGYIRSMERNEKNEMKVTIEFSGDRIAEYGMEEMSHIELAYATTVHKAMGSEFDIVILPVLRSHYIMLNRNIVYTAITRAKEQVIPVGQKKTLIMAILKKTTGKRNTLLGERIGKYLNAFARREELKKVS